MGEKPVLDNWNVVGSKALQDVGPLNPIRYLNDALRADTQQSNGVYRPDMVHSNNDAYVIFDLGGPSTGATTDAMNKGGGYVKVKDIHITWEVDNRNRSHTRDVACLGVTDQTVCTANPCCEWTSSCAVRWSPGHGHCNENMDRCDSTAISGGLIVKNDETHCALTRGMNFGNCVTKPASVATHNCTYVPGQAPQVTPGIPSHSVPETFQILSSMSSDNHYGTGTKAFCPCQGDPTVCSYATNQANEGPVVCDMADAELVLNLTLPYDRKGNPDEYSLNGGSEAPSFPIVTTVRKDVLWNGNVDRDGNSWDHTIGDSWNFPGLGPWGNRSVRDVPVPVLEGLPLPDADGPPGTKVPDLVSYDTMSISFENTPEGFLATRYLVMKFTIPDNTVHRVGINRFYIGAVDNLCGPHRINTADDDRGPPMELAVMPLEEGTKNIDGQWVLDIDWHCDNCTIPHPTPTNPLGYATGPPVHTSGVYYARPGQTLKFTRTSVRTAGEIPTSQQDITQIDPCLPPLPPCPVTSCLPKCTAAPPHTCGASDYPHEELSSGGVKDVFVKSEWVGHNITFQSRDQVDRVCLMGGSANAPTTNCYFPEKTECDQGLWITVHVLPHLQCEAALAGTWNAGNDPAVDKKNYSLYPDVDLFGCVDEPAAGFRVLGTCKADNTCSPNCISTLAQATGGSWTTDGSASCANGNEVNHMSTCSLECDAGFRPVGSLSPKCAYGMFTATTDRQCDAIPCPAQSHTSQGNPGTVGEGCVCVTGSSGTIVATNTEPYYTGSCQDTEECANNPCAVDPSDTSTCSETSDGVTAAINTYFCNCPAGYIGGGAETACVEVTVEHGTVSSDRNSCTCNSGYAGCGNWSGTNYPSCAEVVCAPYDFASTTGVIAGDEDGCTDGIQLSVFADNRCAIKCDDGAGYIPTTSTVECPMDANADGTTIPGGNFICHKKGDDGLEPWVIGVIAGAGVLSIAAMAVACRKRQKRLSIKPVAQLDMTGDGKVDHIAIDTTGDGKADTVVDLSQSGGVKQSFNIDRSGDGHVDEVAIDTTGDGVLDTRMHIDEKDSAAR